MIYPGWCFHGRAGYFDACCSGIAVMLQRRLDAGIVESVVHNTCRIRQINGLVHTDAHPTHNLALSYTHKK